jgi:hypothetical protein
MRNTQEVKQALMEQPIVYEGSRYSPISHKEVIETIEEQFDKENLRFTNFRISTGNHLKQCVLHYIFNPEEHELGFSMSFKNSVDGTMSFGLATGANVMICSNGIVYGSSFSYKRKHTGSAKIEISEALKTGFETANSEMETQLERMNRLKEVHVDKRIQAELIGRMYIEEGIIQSHQMSALKNQLIQPTYEYGAPDTMWELLNYTTFAMKEAPALNWHKQHTGVCDFMLQNS